MRLGRLDVGRLAAPAIGKNSREEAAPRMLRFAMNRIFWFIPTILAMAAFTFLIMQATPGSPFDVSDKQRPEDIQRRVVEGDAPVRGRAPIKTDLLGILGVVHVCLRIRMRAHTPTMSN